MKLFNYTMHQKPYLLITEISPGYNSHDVYSTFEDANHAMAKAESEGQSPICIFNLNDRVVVYFDEDFPPYGETIVKQIISMY